MKKLFLFPVLGLLVLAFLNNGYGQNTSNTNCPTKYVALAKTAVVTGKPGGWTNLFEVTDLETVCYKEVRIFVHVFNNSYKTLPFPPNAKMTISAFHGIGKGSWSYFSKEFPQKFTSEFHGFVDIPVIGEKTRLVVSGYNMPGVILEVDVAAYLVR